MTFNAMVVGISRASAFLQKMPESTDAGAFKAYSINGIVCLGEMELMQSDCFSTGESGRTEEKISVP